MNSEGQFEIPVRGTLVRVKYCSRESSLRKSPRLVLFCAKTTCLIKFHDFHKLKWPRSVDDARTWIKIWHHKNSIRKRFTRNRNKHITAIFEWKQHNINKFCDNCQMFNCSMSYAKECNSGPTPRYLLKILDVILVSLLISDFPVHIAAN